MCSPSWTPLPPLSPSRPSGSSQCTSLEHPVSCIEPGLVIYFTYDRGWDGWMASPTQWTWVWVDSRSWWRTGRPGILQFMGSQRVGPNWATELNWIYMFQCYSLKSSHPYLLPQSPKVCSLYLCLFCCLAYKVIVTVSVLFFLTSLCVVGSNFIHFIRTDLNVFFLMAE